MALFAATNAVDANAKSAGNGDDDSDAVDNDEQQQQASAKSGAAAKAKGGKSKGGKQRREQADDNATLLATQVIGARNATRACVCVARAPIENPNQLRTCARIGVGFFSARSLEVRRAWRSLSLSVHSSSLVT